MARMIGRSRTAPPMPGLKTPTIDENNASPDYFPLTPHPVGVPSRTESDESIASKTSGRSSVKSSVSSLRSGGGRSARNGMDPASFHIMANPTSNNLHSAAIGRGQNQTLLTQQQYHPFLDDSHFVERGFGGGSGSFNPTASHVSVESSVSRTTTSESGSLKQLENFIYLEIEVFLHENGQETSIAVKTIGFDSHRDIHDVMHEIVHYVDVKQIKPLHLFCKNTGSKLETGTLAANKIESEFLLDFHIEKDTSIPIVSADSAPVKQRVFCETLTPNTVHFSLLLFNTSFQVLTTSNGLLPTVKLTEDDSIVDSFGKEQKDFLWLKSKSLEFEISALEALNRGSEETDVFSASGIAENIKLLEEGISKATPQKLNSASLKTLRFRLSFYIGLQTLQKVLNLNRLGIVYHRPVAVQALRGCFNVLAVQFCSHAVDAEIMKVNGFKWRAVNNLNPNFYKLGDDKIWALYVKYFQRRKYALAPGVYLALFRVRNTTDSIDILTLETDPDLIPLTRIRSSVGLARTGSSTSQSQSHGASIPSLTHSSTTDKSVLLTPEEKTYLSYLAENDRDPTEMLPKGFVVTKELESFGKSLKTAMKVLSSQIGGQEFELGQVSPLSPVQYGSDVQIILLTEELATTTHQQTARPTTIFGKLGKLALGGSSASAKEESKEHVEHPDEKKQLTYLPIALFEMLHHHNYNEGVYSSFRRQLDSLNTQQLVCDVSDGKATNSSSEKAQLNMQQILAQLNDKKKEWNNKESWALKSININRERAMALNVNSRK